METPDNEVFRDSIGTINEEGKRNWIFPKKPSGPYYDKPQNSKLHSISLSICCPFRKN